MEIRRHRLAAGQVGLLDEQLAVADDGVERRAEFVTHVGEERALGAAGGLRLVPGPFELVLLGLKRRQVAAALGHEARDSLGHPVETGRQRAELVASFLGH